MLNSKEPINVAHFEKLTNQSICSMQLISTLHLMKAEKKFWAFDKSIFLIESFN